MDPILSLHRREIAQPEPEAFLGYFPRAFLQYFDDTPARDPRKALSTPHFRPAQAAARQRDGCGVYFSPNAFVGGRRRECLRRIQAIFLDIDAGKAGDGQPIDALERRKADALLSLLASPHPPHAVTETKHGLQPLWRVAPLEVPEGLALFRVAIEGLLLRFGADPAARDPVRPIRLPGFLHLKDPADPFLCRLLWNDLDREPASLRSLIDDLDLPPVHPETPRVPRPPSPSQPTAPGIAEVIRAAAREAGIDVALRTNRDGSRQIVEDGEVTSGFVSARGNFCYSSSGKARKGGPLQLVQYYLGLDRERARRWLDDRFGPPGRARPRASPRAPSRPAASSTEQRPPHPPAPNGHPANSPERLARDPDRAMDVPGPSPLTP